MRRRIFQVSFSIPEPRTNGFGEFLVISREKDLKLCQSSEERIKTTTERVEHMCQKVEDINQKENAQTASIQSVEFRLRKIEDVAEQMLNHIAVVHRFMATYMRDFALADLPEIKTSMDRLRRTSERSDDAKPGGGSGGGGTGEGVTYDRLLTAQNRRKPTRYTLKSLTDLNSAGTDYAFSRSMTEVRPHDNLFLSNEGLQFEPRPHEPVAEEEGGEENFEDQPNEVPPDEKSSFAACRRCVLSAWTVNVRKPITPWKISDAKLFNAIDRFLIERNSGQRINTYNYQFIDPD